MPHDFDAFITSVGPRLRALRQLRETTLAQLSEATGISVSTLSRLESGQRRPNLELLLPIAHAHQVPLDEIVGSPAVADPRVKEPSTHYHDRTVVQLSRQTGGVQAFRQIIPAETGPQTPVLQTHEGYEWLYVLSGRLRLVLGEHDLILKAGEAAEFDTRVPHWSGSAGNKPVEFLSLFGPQGERVHLRAKSRPRR